MKFTPAQLQAVQEALEVAYEAKLKEFEQHAKKAEIGSLQLAVRSFKDVKRFSELLGEIRERENLSA